MTRLEERIRSGLQQTAAFIPEAKQVVRQAAGKGAWKPRGIWVGAAAALTILALFIPILFWLGSDDSGTLGELDTPAHIRLSFVQELTLTCRGLEIVDNGGFDNFTMDVWIDDRTGFARMDITYPDGSEHDLIFEGRPGAWEAAWGRGIDLGRSAGCKEAFDDGSSEQSIAGWAFQDASVLWFSEFLTPVVLGENSAVIDFERRSTRIAAVGERTYTLESEGSDGTHARYEFTLDESGTHVVGEQRHLDVPGQFEVNATVAVLDSDPAMTSTALFDTTDFTPLWGRTTVVTTAATP